MHNFVFRFLVFLVASNLFSKLGASQTQTTSLKNKALRSVIVLYVLGQTLLQIRQRLAILFFSLKGFFLINLYYFRDFSFDFELFWYCCPYQYIFVVVIFVCFVIQTRIFYEVRYCVKSVRIAGKCGPYSVQTRENADQNNSEYGHFLRSEDSSYYFTKP